MMLSAWDTTVMPASQRAMPGGATMQGRSAGMGGMKMSYNYLTINGKAFPARR